MNSLKVLLPCPNDNVSKTKYIRREEKEKKTFQPHQPFELLPLTKYFYTKPICFECFHVNLISSFEINSFHSLYEKSTKLKQG